MAKKSKKSLNNTLASNSALPLVVLLGLISLMIAPQIDHIIASNHIIFKTLIALVGVFLLLFYRLYSAINTPFMPVYFSPARWALSALLLLGALSLIWSNNIDFSLSKLLLWLIAAGFMFYVLRLSHNIESLSVLAWGLSLTAFLVALIGVLQYFELLNFIAQLIPPASTFANKNFAGHLLVLLLPILMFLWLKAKNTQLIWLVVALPIIIAYIFYTKTRAAWLSVLVELLALFIYLFINKKTLSAWWNKTKTYALILAILLTALLVNLSPVGWMPASQNVISSIDKSISQGTGRERIWAQAGLMIAQKPLLGSGIGSFAHNIASEVYSDIKVIDTQKAHNDLLELGVELGIVGWLVFVLILATLMHCFVLLMSSEQGQKRLFYFAIFTGLLGSSVNLLFSFPYQLILPMLVFVLYAGLLIRGSDKHNPYLKTKQINLNPTKVYAGLGLLSLLFGLGLWVLVSWINTFDNINTYLNNIKQSRFNSQLIIKPAIYNAYLPNTLKVMARQMVIGGADIGAFHAYNAMLKIYPNYKEGLFELGRIYAKADNKVLSGQYLNKLFALSPLIDTQIKAIDVSIKHNNVALAKDLFKQFSTRIEALKSPKIQERQAIIRLAILLKYSPREIQELYQQYALPIDESIENNMIYYYAQSKNWQASVPHIHRVFSLNPNHSSGETYQQILKKYDR